MGAFCRWRVSRHLFCLIAVAMQFISLDASISHDSIGGMAGGIVTAPFDLIKTRLQSDTYQLHQAKSIHAPKAVIERKGIFKLLHAFVETGHILSYAALCSFR